MCEPDAMLDSDDERERGERWGDDGRDAWGEGNSGVSDEANDFSEGDEGAVAKPKDSSNCSARWYSSSSSMDKSRRSSVTSAMEESRFDVGAKDDDEGDSLSRRCQLNPSRWAPK